MSLTEGTDRYLRFVLGEIDLTLPGGTHVRADLFERRDGQWSWSAEVTALEVKFDARGNSGDAPGRPVKAGPKLVPTEAQATEEALTWIRAQLGPTP